MPESHSQPDAEMKIGVAVVVLNGKVIVGTREGNQHLAGMDEFPGGKCEPQETPADCAVRECLEECGFKVKVDVLLHREQFDYPEASVDLYFYLCRPARTDNTTRLPSPFRWVDLDKLNQCRFPAGNQQVLERLEKLALRTF